MSVASLSAPKSSTPLRENGVNGHHHHHNGQENGDSANGNKPNNKPPAPKTLPKPKVKPVPPPKPKKSFAAENGVDGNSSQAPLISFQDEGVDGSEV